MSDWRRNLILSILLVICLYEVLQTITQEMRSFLNTNNPDPQNRLQWGCTPFRRIWKQVQHLHRVWNRIPERNNPTLKNMTIYPLFVYYIIYDLSLIYLHLNIITTVLSCLSPEKKSKMSKKDMEKRRFCNS